MDFCSCNLHSCAAYEPWRHPCFWSWSRGNGYSPFMSNTVLESGIFVSLLCIFWGNLCKQVQYVFNYKYFRVTLMLWRSNKSQQRYWWNQIDLHSDLGETFVMRSRWLKLLLMDSDTIVLTSILTQNQHRIRSLDHWSTRHTLCSTCGLG